MDIEPAPGKDLSWAMSHLPRPEPMEERDVLGILQAWLDQRPWGPARESRPPVIWAYAERHGFAGLLGALALAGLLPPGELAERGQRRYWSNTLHHQQSLRVCRALQASASQRSIPMAFIKGPALAERIYGDPGLRSHADLDVLVRSREDALVLLDSLHDPELALDGPSRFVYRLTQPGRLHARHHGWEIEFMHPLQDPCDPMFEVLHRHRERILRVPDAAEVPFAPDPELHLLLLMAHMANHLCSRLIWFLDLVVLVRRQGSHVGVDWLEEELDRLQMRNLGARISWFCRRYLDDRFPLLASGAVGWNTPIQEALASLEQLQAPVSLFHSRGWRRGFSWFLSPSRYYLITDPLPAGCGRPCLAPTWLRNRSMQALQSQSRTLGHLLELFIRLVSLSLPLIFRVYALSFSSESRCSPPTLSRLLRDWIQGRAHQPERDET